MRIAVLDLGTNTFNLLVAEPLPGGRYAMLYNEKTPVRLGEGGINSGFITEAAFERGLRALAAFHEVIQSYNVSHIAAFGTSALRNASNGPQFIATALEQTGIRIELIDGNREAELIYQGVRDAVQLTENCSLIIDIGGGSTEFILANNSTIFWQQSFEIGAARLLERFQPSDPLQQAEEDAMRLYFDDVLAPLYAACALHPPTELIGSAGSFESLAEMIAHRFYTPDMLHGQTSYTFNFEQSELLYHELKRSTRAERTQMKGLIAMRVDMMVVSAILVQHVIEQLGLKQMRMSTYSLKEGAIRELLDKAGE